MQTPRFGFTIRQLLALIAICAVVFALLRTPVGFLVIAVASVLPGFLIQRARGGEGILGGALSAALTACLLVCAAALLFFVSIEGPRAPRLGELVVAVLFSLFPASLLAFLLGWIFSCMIYAMMKRTQAMLKRPLLEKSLGQMQWIRLQVGREKHI
jgi:hypothetical protein